MSPEIGSTLARTTGGAPYALIRGDRGLVRIRKAVVFSTAYITFWFHRNYCIMEELASINTRKSFRIFCFK